MINNLIISLAQNGFWPWLDTKEAEDFKIFFRIGKFQIAWYAVFILAGMILCLLRCKYELKKKNMPTDYYDNFFLSVIPISIVGARLWYVISNLSEFHSFADVIGFNSNTGLISLGGLAIQGGVVFGVAWGIFYYTKIKKRYPLGLHFDLVVPCILIGQILGRWGNFFNGEVYGTLVNRDYLKWWIPKFIIDYCTGTDVHTAQVGKGMVHIPLFYIEGLINIVGFVLIGYVIWRFWKKFRKPYQVGSLYFIWYGIVRLCLEPLRDPQFIMGSKYGFRTSIFMSILYVIGGLSLFIFAAIYYRKVPFEKIYVNEAEEAKEREKQEEHDRILNEKIEAKKAEIRARKAKEKGIENGN